MVWQAAALLGSSIIGAKAAQDANKSALAANRANIAARERERTQLMGRNTPFEQTNLTPSGVQQTFTGTAAGDAGKTRDILARGDVGRAGRFNEATSRKPTFANMGEARDFATAGNVYKQGEYDRGVNALIEQGVRADKGVGNTGMNANLARGIGNFAERQAANLPQETLNAYNTQNTQDQALIQAIRANQQSQGPVAPGFTAPSTNVLAQVPGREGIKDLGGVIPAAAGADFVKNLLARQDQAARDKAFQDRFNQSLAADTSRSNVLLDYLKSQNQFGGTTTGTQTGGAASTFLQPDVGELPIRGPV